MVIHIEYESRKTLICVTLKELTDSFREGRVMTKRVIPSRVSTIKRLLVENANLQPFYFSPIIAHMENGVLEHELNGKITIIDGTQRVHAFVDLAMLMEKNIHSMINHEADIAWKNYYLMENWRIPILIFEGLSKTEQHNFSVECYKNNPYPMFISKEQQIDSISNNVIELDEGDFFTTKTMSLTQLKQIVSIFVTGKLMGKVKDANFIPVLHREEYVQLIHYWMKRLNEICIKNPSFKSFCQTSLI